MQRRRDDTRLQHVLDGDEIAILCRRIHRRMQTHSYRDLGKLLRGGAVFVHVTLRDHRIGADRGDAEWPVELLRRIATTATAAGADREPRRGNLRAIKDD